MAFTSRIIHAPPEAIWAVLIDPHTYPHWLIGAAEIRDVDDAWPAIGSRFHHRVGIGVLSIPDSTAIEDVIEPEMLRLAVRARPFVSATATFRLVGDGTTTVVSVEEEPKLRLPGNVVRPLMDPAVHVRNHRSLRRLDRLVLRRNDAAAP